MMKSRKVRIVYILLFLLCVSVTFFVIFRNNDINLIFNNLQKVDLRFIFLAILCMFGYISGEGINIRRVLKTSGHNVSYLNSFKYASIGFFFSSITPSSTGGDPAQLFFMSKDKLPVSLSALALLVELTSYQFVLCILSLLGLATNYSILMSSSNNFKYFLFLGMFINFIYLTFLVMMIFSKSTVIKILKFVRNILKKFKYKKSDLFYDKCIKQVDEYHKCAIYLKNHKIVLLKIFVTTLIQMIMFYSVSYFVYRSFGLHGENFLTFVLLQASLSMAVSYMPMPGTVGASEGAFMIMFKTLFPIKFLSSAMLITRGINFYLFIIITGVIVLCSVFYRKICKKNESIDV